MLGYTNKYDTYYKVSKVIKSCKTNKQLKVCENLVTYYRDLYNDTFLTDDLVNIGSIKFNELNPKRKRKKIGY